MLSMRDEGETRMEAHDQEQARQDAKFHDVIRHHITEVRGFPPTGEYVEMVAEHIRLFNDGKMGPIDEIIRLPRSSFRWPSAQMTFGELVKQLKLHEFLYA